MSQQYKSAVHLFMIQNQQVLLSCRANTGYMDGYYSVVAGHLEPGETVVETAIREAQEEAGLTLLPKNIEVVQVMHRRDGDERIDFFVRVHAWQGEIRNAEPQKCNGLGWFPLDKLPENTVPYVRQALHNYRQEIWFESFGWDK